MAALLLKTKNEPQEQSENKNDGSISVAKKSNTKLYSYTIFEIAVLILSVFSIFIDLCTDLVLVIQYSNQGYKSWAIGTFLLIFFPSVVVQFFSLRWHIVDNTASVLHWVLHFCMLGILHRYVQIIKAAFAAFKSKNSSDIQKIFFEQSDLCMLHLFESFLESAPQLVLQIYVIVMLHEWRFWTGLSAFASLLSLAWALAAYTKAQRRARGNKNTATWPGLLLQAIWRAGMLTARISTLVLGAYCFGNYIFLIITIHWLAMTVWIIYQKTDFCETYWEEKIYNAVVGVIYCFCFFNLQEGQSRWRALAFYLVIVFQNLTCLTIFLMWFGDKNPKLAVSGFIAVVVGTVLGSMSMLFYYRFFHPSGPIKLIFSSGSASNQETSSPYSTLTLRSLKRIRSESLGEAQTKNTPQPVLRLDEKNACSPSDSVVIIEENVLDDSDSDIKILQDWINEVNDNRPVEKKETKETEDEAYKRRAICSSVDLVKLIEPKTKSENGSIKLGTDEASSEVLSAHDYENLCAVNIAREAWGLRSWQGYSDIESWLHDDSVVHDRRLDTLTSTTSSDRSANTFQKENGATRQDEYIEAIAEDLAQCESEASSDDVLGQYSIESLPIVYPLGGLDPIFEEAEESSVNSDELNDLKTTNGSVSTLVATIDQIRRNTPIQNRYRRADGMYDNYSPHDVIPKLQRQWRKVSFASKLQTFPENKVDLPNITTRTEQLKNQKENFPEKNTVLKKKIVEIEPSNKKETNLPINLETKKNCLKEVSNKENIPTLTSKIIQWNKIFTQNGKQVTPTKTDMTAKNSFWLGVLSSPNFPLQKKK